MHCFAFPPARNESSHCSISLPAFGVTCTLDLHHIIDAWWYLTAILIPISLLTCDLKYFLMCVFVICISLMISCPFFNQVVYYCWILRALYVLGIIDVSFANIFSQSVTFLLILLISLFTEQKFLFVCFNEVQLNFFSWIVSFSYI